MEYIMWNAGLDEAQAGIKIARRDLNNLRHADNTTLMAESKEELKSFLMKVKEESEKAGLKFNFQKTRIMASRPIASRQINGETMETVKDFLFGGSKITAMVTAAVKLKDSCSLEEKLWPTKTAYHIKRQKHFFTNKGPSSQSYGFSSSHVWMQELDNKEVWVQKNWCLQTVVWEALEQQVDQISQS